MKKYIPYIILVTILVLITSLIVYTLFFNKEISKKTFNLQKGDILTFDSYDVSLEILNIAETSCKKEDCQITQEIEVSVMVTYNDVKTSYALKTVTNNQEKIKDSNYYLVLTNKENELKINVVDRHDI